MHFAVLDTLPYLDLGPQEVAPAQARGSSVLDASRLPWTRCFPRVHCLQAAWLLKDLSLVNRTATPWVIVTTHVPMYCSAIDEPAPPGEGGQTAPPPYAGCIADGISVGDRMQKDLEPVLMAGGVDLFTYGHIHAYESTCERCSWEEAAAGGVGGASVLLALDVFSLARRSCSSCFQRHSDTTVPH